MSKEPSGCIVTLVKDTLDPETLGHLDKHGPIIDVNNLLRIYLSDIQGNPEHVCIGFAIVDKAR